MAGRSSVAGGSTVELGIPRATTWAGTGVGDGQRPCASTVVAGITGVPMAAARRSSTCLRSIEAGKQPTVVRARPSSDNRAHARRAANLGRPKVFVSEPLSRGCGWVEPALSALSSCRPAAAPQALEVRTLAWFLRSAGRALAPRGGRDRPGDCRAHARARARDRSRVGQRPGE